MVVKKGSLDTPKGGPAPAASPPARRRLAPDMGFWMRILVGDAAAAQLRRGRAARAAAAAHPPRIRNGSPKGRSSGAQKRSRPSSPVLSSPGRNSGAGMFVPTAGACFPGSSDYSLIAESLEGSNSPSSPILIHSF